MFSNDSSTALFLLFLLKSRSDDDLIRVFMQCEDRRNPLRSMQLISVCIIISAVITAVLCKRNDDCRGTSNGHYINGYGCNNTYTECRNGFAAIRQCPKPLYFDVDVGKCLEWSEVDRCVYPSEEYKTMLPAICTGEPNKCKSKGPHSPYYTCCKEGILIEGKCKENNVEQFDAIRNKCIPIIMARMVNYIRQPFSNEVTELYSDWMHADWMYERLPKKIRD